MSLLASLYARPSQKKGPIKNADPLIAQYRRALEAAHVEHARLAKWREGMPKHMDGSRADAEVRARMQECDALIESIPSTISACQLSYAAQRLGAPHVARPPPPPDYARLWAEHRVPSAGLDEAGPSAQASMSVLELPPYEEAPPAYAQGVA